MYHIMSVFSLIYSTFSLKVQCHRPVMVYDREPTNLLMKGLFFMRLAGRVLIRKNSAPDNLPRTIRILDDSKRDRIECMSLNGYSEWVSDDTELLEHYDVSKHSYVMSLNKVKVPIKGKFMYDLIITINKNSRLEKENVLVFSLLSFLKKAPYIDNSGQLKIPFNLNPEEYSTISEVEEFDEDYVPVIPNINIVDRKVYFLYNTDKNFYFMKINLSSWLFKEVIEDSDPNIVFGFDEFGINFNFVKSQLKSVYYLLSQARLFFSIASTIRVFDIRYLMYIVSNKDIEAPNECRIHSSDSFMEFWEKNRNNLPDIIKKMLIYIKNTNIYPGMPSVPFTDIDLDSVYFVDTYHEYPVICEKVLEIARKHNEFITEIYFPKNKRTLFMVYKVKEIDNSVLSDGETPTLDDDELRTFFSFKK